MAQSLFDKLNTLFKMSFHSIVDGALQRNAIPVLEQYLRDHEDALTDLETNLAFIIVEVKSATEDVEVHKEDAIKYEAKIVANLQDGDESNDFLTKNDALQLTGAERLVEQTSRTLAATESTKAALEMAREKLFGRIISLKNQIKLLKAIEVETDIKTMTADFLIESAEMLSSHSTSVDRLTDAVMTKRDKADARFEMSLLKSARDGGDTRLQSEANDRLAEIRARLGQETGVPEAIVSPLDMTPAELESYK